MSRAMILVAGIGLATGVSPVAGAGTDDWLPTPATSDDSFCEWVQQQVAGTGMRPAENIVYDDEASFRKSKTQVRPLTTHQYVLRSDDGRDLPRRVSCKVKTPDHIVAEYGASAAAAGDDFRCRDLNREVARKVFEGLGADPRNGLRFPEASLVFDEDLSTFMGAQWVGDFAHAYRDDEGRLHLRAKVLRVDWENVLFSWAPESVRGAWYCHMTAPEYLRELVLGEAEAPAG